MTLELLNAHVGYPGLPPLVQVDSWKASSGGLHAILGANGSGKSTLLRSVLGVIPLLQGSVQLVSNSGVCRPVDRSKWVRHVAYVASTPPSNVGLTVQEVLELSGSSELAASRIDRIRPWLNRRLAHLSDGQAQLVMVARAMLQSKDWIVLDEPTAFLDVKAQIELWAMLEEHVSGGGSVLLATHDLRGVHMWLSKAPADLQAKSSLSLVQDRVLKPQGKEASLEDLERLFVEE